VLDLGTGTGCILLTLLAERPAARGLGTDISAAALAVAAVNAERLALDARADFLRANWWQGVTGQFDLIVSNPPYISAEEMKLLDADVQVWEPQIALTPGGDGLNAYREIAACVASFLSPKGRLLVEIGPSQADAVTQIFRTTGLSDCRVLPDLDGRDRVILARVA
jgi:release factor glutamine methyltransferase